MSKNALISDYLSNLKVELYTVNFGKCTSDWKDIDYIPDYSKFYFIIDGEGWLKIGDTGYYPKPGQLFLMPDGILQSYSSISSNTYLKYWCHFSARIGDVNLFKILQLKHFINAPDKMLLEKIFIKMAVYFNSDEMCSKLMAKVKLMELISYFIMNINSNEITVNNYSQVDKLNKALDYIHNHLCFEITLQNLAEIAYMHPNYFIRIFKEYMGVPPIHYINKKRIEKAKELLLSTGLIVSEISELVGFGDPFYFSRQFKKNVGLTPTEFRMLQQTSGMA